MLSVYATHGSMVDEETLKRHFRLLVKDKASLAIKAAVVVYENGNVADRVGKISVKSKDLKIFTSSDVLDDIELLMINIEVEFRRTFDVSEAETVRFNGVTYCVKDLSTNQIVAFNGAKYLIVTRTEVTPHSWKENKEVKGHLQDAINQDFQQLWQHEECHYAKSFLFLFQISHLIVISHPGSSFDVTYVRLFRILDTIRMKVQKCVQDQLMDLPISKDWKYNGRPCSPRVLFVFETATLDYDPDEMKISPIKRLQHCMEDQIYKILRKSRVITNISNNSLFAVPANQEFVFIHVAQNHISDPVSGTSLPGERSRSSPLSRGGGEFSFKEFLWQHIDMALTKGFDDNVGRHPVAANFELAQAKKVFSQFARGPGCDKYVGQLEESCERFWRNGRQLCEEVSLTGNHCVNPLHRTDDDPETLSNSHLPCMSHSSQLKMVAACNCGRSKGDREDPFTHKSYKFPTFQPSTSDIRAAAFSLKDLSAATQKLQVRDDDEKVDNEKVADDAEAEVEVERDGGGADLFVGGHQSNCSPLPDQDAVSNPDHTDAHTPGSPDVHHVSSPVRQHSTTEYLPGMIHTDSPSGLLPKFPSWSLTSRKCIATDCDYICDILGIYICKINEYLKLYVADFNEMQGNRLLSYFREWNFKAPGPLNCETFLQTAK
ncbi:SMG8-like protein [Mya arenaria]|uniref:Nonsense-mediated mRNA decay factor SMG8 n=1 Tax=Mya arenaria TaxID=6604 RepID=A0ABY7EWF1_MYAAR|nr:SMG8-like protein [Mya arenaria]